MNKELNIRKRIATIYNKGQEHFPSLRDYNDYLEEVEDIINNLVDGIDVPAIEAKIKAYSEANYDQIIASKAQKAELDGKAYKDQRGDTIADQVCDGLSPFLMRLALQDAQITGAYAPAIAPGMQQRQPEPVGSGVSLEPQEETEEMRKVREDRAAIAGGWSFDFPRKRALHEAFHSIWVN